MAIRSLLVATIVTASSLGLLAGALPQSAETLSAREWIRDDACGDMQRADRPSSDVGQEPPVSGRLDWPGFLLLPEVSDVYWYWDPSADVPRESPYKLVLVLRPCELFLLQRVAELSKFIDPRVIDRTNAEILDLAYALTGVEEAERAIGDGPYLAAMQPDVRDERPQNPWYGCQVVPTAESIDLSSASDRDVFSQQVFIPPTVQRVDKRLEVSFLCVYPDLNGSIRKQEVVIEGELVARVTTTRTGYGVVRRKLVEDTGFYK